MAFYKNSDGQVVEKFERYGQEVAIPLSDVQVRNIKANLKQKLVDKENLEENMQEAQTQIEIKEKEIEDLNSGIEDTKQEIGDIEEYFNQFNGVFDEEIFQESTQEE